MTTSARDGLTIHAATIERMERREEEVAGLEGRLQASRDEVRQQEQVIKDILWSESPTIFSNLRKERDAIRCKAQELDIEVTDLRKGLQKARDRIKQQDQEICNWLRPAVMYEQRDPVTKENLRVANDEWLKATKEVADLKMFLKEASDTINGQDQVIKGREEGITFLRNDLQSVRKVRDRLYGERDDLKKQINVDKAVTILICDKASKHIVNQDKKIIELRAEAYHNECRIKKLEIRLANCGHYAELAIKARDSSNRNLHLRNIIVEADIGTDASQATNVKTGEVHKGSVRNSIYP